MLKPQLLHFHIFKLNVFFMMWHVSDVSHYWLLPGIDIFGVKSYLATFPTLVSISSPTVATEYVAASNNANQRASTAEDIKKSP